MTSIWQIMFSENKTRTCTAIGDHRGLTPMMWLMRDMQDIHSPTHDECRAILCHRYPRRDPTGSRDLSLHVVKFPPTPTRKVAWDSIPADSRGCFLLPVSIPRSIELLFSGPPDDQGKA